MDLIDEVTRDIENENHYKAFKRLLPYVVGLTLLLIIGMSIRGWVVNKNNKHNAEMGDLLNNAIVLAISGQDQAAKESFEYILKEAKNNSKDLAALGLAIQLFNTDKNSALKSFEEIAENKKYQELTQDYAKILWLNVCVDLPIDKINSQKMAEYINSFSNEKKTFYGTANLIKSLWLIKQEKSQEAEVVLNQIINSKFTNYTNKNNAQAILANLKARKYIQNSGN